jgi:c-di-GMP-binding flagellar brake protein YcgR
VSQERERRKHTRLPKSYRLELAEFVFPLKQQPRISAVCEDVSAGGLAGVVPRRFEVGDKVQVRLHMARLNKFHPGFSRFSKATSTDPQAVAEVVRVEERVPFASYCLGLRFTDVYDDDWARPARPDSR